MEVIARDLRTLPPAITGAMRRLRRIDVETRDALEAIKAREEALFEELSKAEKERKENSVAVDEDAFVALVERQIAVAVGGHRIVELQRRFHQCLHMDISRCA